jgi:hypothetical protein
MSYEGHHREQISHLDRRKRFVAEALTITAVVGSFGASAAYGARPDNIFTSLARPIARHFDTPSTVTTLPAMSTERSLSPADIIRQHRVRLLVGSIAKTLYSQDMDCGGLFENPTCTFRTFAYEEPTSASITYNSYDTIQSEAEGDIQQLIVENFDCSVGVTKNSHGEYRTTVSANQPATARTADFTATSIPRVNSPISESDVECLVNIDQRLKALPDALISYEVAGTYRI